MRSYFFGDIHGNNYALERVLAHLDEVGPDRVYCLGDVVGWLPFGDRSWRRMRTLNIPTVAGNHDLLVAGCFTDDPKQLDRIQATAFNAGLLATYPDAIPAGFHFPSRRCRSASSVKPRLVAKSRRAVSRSRTFRHSA